MESIFNKDEIVSYEYKNLNNKTLKLGVVESEDGLVVYGIDINTGEFYLLINKIRIEEKL